MAVTMVTPADHLGAARCDRVAVPVMAAAHRPSRCGGRRGCVAVAMMAPAPNRRRLGRGAMVMMVVRTRIGSAGGEADDDADRSDGREA